MIEILIFVFCAAGMSYTAYKEGSKQGAANCLEILREKKIICFDNTGQIKPNPFFDHDPWVDPEEIS